MRSESAEVQGCHDRLSGNRITFARLPADVLVRSSARTEFLVAGEHAHSIVNRLAGALWRRRFRLVMQRRYRQRYRKFHSAVVNSEKTVSDNQPALPLKDRGPRELKDGFFGNTVFDTVKYVPMRSRQSSQKPCWAPNGGKHLCYEATSLEAMQPPPSKVIVSNSYADTLNLHYIPAPPRRRRSHTDREPFQRLHPTWPNPRRSQHL